MNPKLTRAAAIALIIFAAGFIAGQLVMSSHVKAAAEARRLTLIESTVNRTDDLQQLKQLQALGYVDGTVDEQAELRGVLIHNRERAMPGVNLYSSRIRTSASLIDNDGRELHHWSFPGDDGWEHTELLPNGDIIVIVNQRSVFKLDHDSTLLWQTEIEAHHDLAIHPSGSIYALTDREVLRPDIHPEVPVVEDFITILSPAGEPERQLSILDAMQSSPYAFLLASPRNLPVPDETAERIHIDMLHTNHIQVFDGSLAHRSPLFAEGNVLISMRTINTIAILEPRDGRILWAWGPMNLYRQHHPSLLDNGHIIVFDNGRKRSQIVEIDPLTFEVVWRYAPAAGFFSGYRGGVQRLANGNTLITESDRGYVFEITPDHEEVWRFANPDVRDNDMRIAIWRMTRFGRDELGFLD